MGLLNIGDESYSMTDRINHLLGEQPKKKIDSVPYAVAQASVIANMQEAKIEDGYFINRPEVMTNVPEQLINLGWDKVHPDFFEDLKSWRCPMKVFLGNVMKNLNRDKITHPYLFDPNEFPDLPDIKLIHLRINPSKSLSSIKSHLYKTYLVSAEDYLATYEDDAYSIRMTAEELN
jgi:hypothetical protein